MDARVTFLRDQIRQNLQHLHATSNPAVAQAIQENIDNLRKQLTECLANLDLDESADRKNSPVKG